MKRHFLALIVLGYLSVMCEGDTIERDLLANILRDYSPYERPIPDHREVLVVYIKFALQQIVDLDERYQIITTNAWLDLKWNNYLWRWNTSEYGNINKTRIPFEHIWTPDILLYNSADNNFDSTTHTPVVVDHHGNCLYVPPGIFKSTCKIDVSNFPFDEQRCTLKFGVWSYNGNQVDLQLQPGGGTDKTEYTESGEWRLISLTAQRNEHKYKCCPESFVDVTVTVTLQRRTMFYVINLIVPCILNSVLTLLTFFLPAEAAEKITLAITVLLAQIVFMLLIMEALPPTSDAVPIISKYFACSLVTVCASVGGTVLVLSFYYTSPEIDGKMPPALKKFMLVTAPRWMHMTPFSPKNFNKGEEGRRKRSRVERASFSRIKRQNSDALRTTNKFVEVTLDSLDPNSTSPKKTMECLTKIVNNGFVVPLKSPLSDLHKSAPSVQAPSTVVTSNGIHDEGRKELRDSYLSMTKIEPLFNQECSKEEKQGRCKCTSRKSTTGLTAEMTCLQEILVSLRTINGKLEEDNERDAILLEWQFASRVIDKILLWFFSLFVVVATLATLFAVPNVADAFSM